MISASHCRSAMMAGGTSYSSGKGRSAVPLLAPTRQAHNQQQRVVRQHLACDGREAIEDVGQVAVINERGKQLVEQFERRGPRA